MNMFIYIIVNINYLKESKKSHQDSKKDLFFKIIGGDKSDNIPPIFKKCGPKTIEKCYEDDVFFQDKLKKELGSLEKYQLNKILIDFNNIPEELVNGFNELLISTFE